MNIMATENNGKHTAQVSEAGRIVFQTPEYCTAEMALADAKCWMAFHGGNMDKVTVDLNEVYTARGGGVSLLEYRNVPADRVARHVAQAYEFGLSVEIRTSTIEGTKYILVSDGKGSGYGLYHIGPVFADWALNTRWNETA
jgi:hypothetical protein